MKALRPMTGIVKDGDIWFTQKEDKNSVYIFITDQKDWFKGLRRNFILKNLKATSETTISVLGQNDLVVEYWPENNSESKIVQHDKAFEICTRRAQRLYNDKI